MEAEIQSHAKKKDMSFRLSGKWKKFIKNQSGYKVYSVDGEWIRNNICAYFGHGGHGYVHEFIPGDEIWVSTHHYDGLSENLSCNCKAREKGQKVSNNYFESTIFHEIAECEQMKKGEIFWKAHNYAVNKEKEAGLLKDPYDDTGWIA